MGLLRKLREGLELVCCGILTQYIPLYAIPTRAIRIVLERVFRNAPLGVFFDLVDTLGEARPWAHNYTVDGRLARLHDSDTQWTNQHISLITHIDLEGLTERHRVLIPAQLHYEFMRLDRLYS